MLVLSRQRDETIIIGDDIEITVVDIRGDKVRLGVSAPKSISVHRKEVYDAIRRENVFVDLSSPYLDKALRHRALRALGASRCLYGSDGPYGYPGRDGGYDHGAILRQISQAGLAAQDLDRVLGGNFNSLVAV